MVSRDHAVSNFPPQERSCSIDKPTFLHFHLHHLRHGRTIEHKKRKPTTVLARRTNEEIQMLRRLKMNVTFTFLCLDSHKTDRTTDRPSGLKMHISGVATEPSPSLMFQRTNALTTEETVQPETRAINCCTPVSISLSALRFDKFQHWREKHRQHRSCTVVKVACDFRLAEFFYSSRNVYSPQHPAVN